MTSNFFFLGNGRSPAVEPVFGVNGYNENNVVLNPSTLMAIDYSIIESDISAKESTSSAQTFPPSLIFTLILIPFAVFAGITFLNRQTIKEIQTNRKVFFENYQNEQVPTATSNETQNDGIVGNEANGKIKSLDEYRKQKVKDRTSKNSDNKKDKKAS